MVELLWLLKVSLRKKYSRFTVLNQNVNNQQNQILYAQPCICKTKILEKEWPNLFDRLGRNLDKVSIHCWLSLRRYFKTSIIYYCNHSRIILKLTFLIQRIAIVIPQVFCSQYSRNWATGAPKFCCNNHL